MVGWLNEKGTGRLTLCVCALAFKAWKAWKEWATGTSYPAYPVPCSNIIFHSCAECKKLLSIFALRGGGSGLDLTLHVLINVAWRRYHLRGERSLDKRGEHRPG
ncbi:hypothetical protein T11_11565 [Trichinella zimbabwensis]|uniref:Uncharacterized protein n=1 Tax=Trichinella zimbabwensis TaxID=268475 RepID=A0A0V1GTS1_9BILA|nr:hypothetical protein T11_11565 [Trichinella zimbabwensis]